MSDAPCELHGPKLCQAAKRRVRTRELNDAFRKGKRPELGRIEMTDGVREIAAQWSLGAHGVYEAVRTFASLSLRWNDPLHEHDFGGFQHCGAKLFWRIDYFDKSWGYASPDPSNPDVTTRVLTIMLAREY